MTWSIPRVLPASLEVAWIWFGKTDNF